MPTLTLIRHNGNRHTLSAAFISDARANRDLCSRQQPQLQKRFKAAPRGSHAGLRDGEHFTRISVYPNQCKLH